MLRIGERPKKAAHRGLEAGVGFDRGLQRGGFLRPEDERKLRDDAYKERAVYAQRFAESIPPRRDLRLRLGEDLADQRLHPLDDRPVRDVALELLELARQEVAVALHDWAVQLLDESGLADACFARDQKESRGASLGGQLERADERGDDLLPSIQLLRQLEPFGDVPRAEHERVDTAPVLPLAQALLQIVPQTACALISVLGHLGQELLFERTGIKITYINYKGQPQSLIDMAEGRVHFGLISQSLALPLIQNGKLRPLAVNAAKRTRSLPDVPTIAEAGFPEALVQSWYGIAAPAKTPVPIRNWLVEQFMQTLTMPETRAKLEAIDAEIMTLDGAAFDALIASRGLVLEKERAQTQLDGQMEGLYFRLERDGRFVSRCKYVRPGFRQTIASAGSHWASRPMVQNLLAGVRP